MPDIRNVVDPLTLLKRTEAQLHERELELSRINQEVYKKNLELLQEKRRLEAILYNIAEAVFVLDSNYHFTLFNNTAQNLFGQTETGVLGRTFDSVVSLSKSDGSPINCDRLIKLAVADPELSEKAEYLLKTSKGERVVKTHVSEIKLPYLTGGEYIVLLSDVTTEREVARLKDEFIGIVSHELRTPMTSIKGNLWMLAAGKGGPLSEKAKGYLSKAVRGADRMIALISDILNASSIEQGRIDLQPGRVDLKKLVLEELDEMRARAEEKGIVLEIKDFEGTPTVSADRRRILEVLINLVGNSIKFTNSGYVRVSSSSEGKFVKVSVTDSGKGFAPEDKDKLFLKFGRLDNSYVTVAESGGTGLGLYISKLLVDRMGGQIGAESKGIGQGATFWFTLPVIVN